LLLETPRRVRECLADVVRLEVRIRLEDLVLSVPGSQETYDRPNRHTQAANAGSSAHDVGVPSNSIEPVHDTKYRQVADFDEITFRRQAGSKGGRPQRAMLICTS
jgi:hypothetical protein